MVCTYMCRGVSPRQSLADTLAFRASSRSTTARWPDRQAACRGVVPDTLFSTALTPTPRSKQACTAPTSPRKHASCRVLPLAWFSFCVGKNNT